MLFDQFARAVAWRAYISIVSLSKLKNVVGTTEVYIKSKRE